MPPWRNWLARSAVNRKVGGSSPPGGASFFPSWTSQEKVRFLSLIILFIVIGPFQEQEPKFHLVKIRTLTLNLVKNKTLKQNSLVKNYN